MSPSNPFDAGLTGGPSLMSSPTAKMPSPTVIQSPTLLVGENVSLTLRHDGLVINDPNRQQREEGFLQGFCCMPSDANAGPDHLIPYFNVLWADVMHDYVTIKFAEERSKDVVSPNAVFYPLDVDYKTDADAWCKRLLRLAYGKAQQQKRIKVLVNPFGGKGQAKQLYYKSVEPIFAAAHCEVDVEQTRYSGHGTDIAEKIDIHAYDVIAACSGDGIPYEVFNGFAKRPDATEALQTVPVVNIPCGSGNAMSCNLNGTSSPSMGALCVVKGIRTPLDLVSITHGDQRTLSFLSQSFGIIAESDLGTEHVRWMGSARFTYGFLVRLIRQNCWPCDLAVKTEIGTKEEIKNHYRTKIAEAKDQLAQDDVDAPRLVDMSQEEKGLPPLRYGRVTDPLPDGWQLIPHEKMSNFYAGNMAYMSPDANFFTCALPNDGMIDLITIPNDCGRKTVIDMMFALENNTLFDMPAVNVQKVSGYRLIPRQKEGYISVDGERIPFEPFQAEVHRGLGTTLSRNGYSYACPGPAA
ncbi:coatomer subunit beta [Ascosphaera pollenicola]|nr:coatomer subunit beta [Ascosphaera pollenicola]